jgi:hypothetical protein
VSARRHLTCHAASIARERLVAAASRGVEALDDAGDVGALYADSQARIEAAHVARRADKARQIFKINRYETILQFQKFHLFLIHADLDQLKLQCIFERYFFE